MDQELIDKIKKQYQELEKQLQSPEVSCDPKKMQGVSIEYNDMKETVAAVEKIESLERAIVDAEEAIKADEDPEMTALAKDELTKLFEQREKADEQLQLLLLPKDPNDNKDIIIEIRAGAGGDESALFASELYRSYTRYAEGKGWSVELVSANRIGIGGYKEVMFEVHGVGAYSDFKYESGVHRVQRVPETEKSGRVHTSTVTVAVMPEAEEVDLEIKDADIRIDVFRSGGHGGQSVNTTDSAVRITHLPSGMIVTCQDEKSQHKNKDKAMKVLRSRLLAQIEEERMKERGDERRSQVGTGDRSEKIRTYNFPQDRITDHRIKKNWSEIQTRMDGNIGDIIESLREADKTAQIAKLHTKQE